MEKHVVGLLLIAALVLGGVGGVAMFPKEVAGATVEKIVYVDKPVITEKVVTVEVPKEVVKEVPSACPSPVSVQQSDEFKKLMADYSALARRYERATGNSVTFDDLAMQDLKLADAKSLMQSDYKHLVLDGHRPSEVSFVKFYAEDANRDDVRRRVDGVWRDFDLWTASFTTKVRYSTVDGVSYKTFDVVVKFDIDEDGNDDVTVIVEEA